MEKDQIREILSRRDDIWIGYYNSMGLCHETHPNKLQAHHIKVPERLRPFIEKKKRFKIAFGGRGGGKSFTFGDIFLAQAWKYGYKTLCLREYQSSIKDSVHAMLCSAIDRLPFRGFEKTNDSIRYKGKEVFKFKGIARDPESVKSSFGFQRAWIEEAQTLSEKSLQLLTPTIRDEGSEIWFSMNPVSKDDPMSKRFINPFYKELLRNGYYEDDLHLIIWINYSDNPWHSDALEKERSFAEENMSTEKYKHVWEGYFYDGIEDAIIKPEWFDMCIDAHKKVDADWSGQRVVAHDPSDSGNDDKGLCYMEGGVVRDVQSMSTGEAADGADWAVNYAKANKADLFVFDGDGLGAGLKREFERLLRADPAELVMFRGSESPSNGEYLDGNIKKKNKEVFKNKRAERYILLRDKVLETCRAVKGEPFREDMLISFNGSMGNLDALRVELCRIPLAKNVHLTGKLQIMSKPDMKKMGIDSPNLADSLMMAQERVVKTPSFDIEFDTMF